MASQHKPWCAKTPRPWDVYSGTKGYLLKCDCGAEKPETEASIKAGLLSTVVQASKKAALSAGLAGMVNNAGERLEPKYQTIRGWDFGKGFGHGAILYTSEHLDSDELLLLGRTPEESVRITGLERLNLKSLEDTLNGEKEGGPLSMLAQLKVLNTDRLSEEEILTLSVFGEGLLAGYSANDLQAPEWLVANTAQLRKEIASRRDENLDKALQVARARRSELRTAEEKRKDLEAEIAELEAKRNRKGPNADAATSAPAGDTQK